MSALRKLKSECGTYTVRPGDTLWAIATEFHTTVGEIVRTNRLGGMRIVIGQPLTIPGYPCQVMGESRAAFNPPTCGGRPTKAYPPRGMQDLVSPGSDVPQTTVPTNAQVKVQLRCSGTDDGTANQRIGDYLRSLGYTVYGIDTAGVGSIFSGVVSIVVSSYAPLTLWVYATNVVNAVRNTTNFTITPGSINASIYSLGGSTYTPPPITFPPLGSGIPSTPVNPGDWVKVTLPATTGGTVGGGQAAAGRIANLLGSTYSVHGVDTNAVGALFGGYLICLVEATQPTTLANIAADCNRIATSVGYSVYQTPGSISAQFYQRAAPGAPAPSPGVSGNSVTPGTGVNAPLGSTSLGIFDSIADSIGLSTGLPLTGAVVAGIAVIGILIFLKT